MIERLARRLFNLAPTRYLNGGPRRYHVGWDLLREADRENYRGAAERLLEELRVPSPSMIKAVTVEGVPAIVTWQAMIDAAIAEEAR